MSRKFYEFSQNTDEVSLENDNKLGIGAIVFIEANSVKEANSRAEDIGIDFEYNEYNEELGESRPRFERIDPENEELFVNEEEAIQELIRDGIEFFVDEDDLPRINNLEKDYGYVHYINGERDSFELHFVFYDGENIVDNGKIIPVEQVREEVSEEIDENE